MTVPNRRCAFAAGEGTSYLNECLLLREERKSRLRGPTSEFDPTETLALAAVWASMLILELVYSDLGLSSGDGA